MPDNLVAVVKAVMAAVALLLVAGCSTTPVILRHPQTGATVKCGPYPATGIPSLSTPEREARCISDYQRQGYERVPE